MTKDTMTNQRQKTLLRQTDKQYDKGQSLTTNRTKRLRTLRQMTISDTNFD